MRQHDSTLPYLATFPSPLIREKSWYRFMSLRFYCSLSLHHELVLLLPRPTLPDGHFGCCSYLWFLPSPHYDYSLFQQSCRIELKMCWTCFVVLISLFLRKIYFKRFSWLTHKSKSKQSINWLIRQSIVCISSSTIYLAATGFWCTINYNSCLLVPFNNVTVYISQFEVSLRF